MGADRPVMIYDGDCRFCRRWIARWQEATGDRVVYRAAQEAAADFPEIPAGAFAGSVQLVEPDGTRHDRADAVFRALAVGSRWGRLAVWAQRRVPGFRLATNAAYEVVARHRTTFSWLTRVFWGDDVRPPRYAVATTVFLRALAVIYLIAFASYGAQAAGLIGSRGISPIADLLPRAAEVLGSAAPWQFPTLLWLDASDASIHALVWAGVACAALALIGVVQPLALFGAWAAYLSLVVAGQDFYGFQWDALLLEAGFLAIFVAPWRWRPGWAWVAPPRVGHFLLVWLLFRLMFAAGAVKLASGDPTWRGFTALEFHHWTQPLPTPLAWWVAQAPEWMHKASCAGVLGVELLLPFGVFLPRRPRLLAAGAFLGLQGIIALTGNYGFFNLLTAALALLLLDDTVFRARDREVASVRWPRWLLPPLGVAVVALSLVPLAGSVRLAPDALGPLARAYQAVAPLRTINGYGLFAVMTTARPEITLQGSDDGVTWRDYGFRFKPGPLDRPPPWIAPYMPRLDWQMWFAALGDVRQSPWMAGFARGLLEGRPEVLALLGSNPFPDAPPGQLRAVLDNYRFTTPAERRATGDWWVREPRAIYFPPVTRRDLR